MATLTQRLTEAEDALHQTLLGRQPLEIRDQNGESIRYSRADPSALRAYINELKQQIALTAGTPLPGGPMRVFL